MSLAGDKVPLGWFAAAAVALAHFPGLAHDDHGAPVFYKMVRIFLPKQFDHSGVELALDELVLATTFVAIPV
jgi:hypothetical protein